MRTRTANDTGWLPLDAAAVRMKRSDKPIRAQIRNERLFAGQHYRVKNDVLELNVPAYLEWLAAEKARRRLPLVERVVLSDRDHSNGWYGEKAPEAPRPSTVGVPSADRSQANPARRLGATGFRRVRATDPYAAEVVQEREDLADAAQSRARVLLQP